MTIELTPEQRDILLHLVEHEISETGPEIRHTSTSQYRDELKVYKHDLRDIAERLKAVPAG